MAINLAELIPSVFTGPNGERLTPEQIARRKEVAQSLLSKATDTSPNAGGWTSILAKGVMGLSYGLNEYRADQATKANAESEASAISSMYEPYTANTESAANSLVGGSVDPAVKVVNETTATPSPEPINMDGNQVYNEFMDTVKTGVNNPYALAAIAATGKAESSFDPKKSVSTWSDPSESGKPGTSGGIMSWRGPRYQALAATGDLSPAGQAKFFLNEDPKLIERLNNATSVEEAQSIINNAWKFAGYDRPGGESERRLNYARSYLPMFQNQPQSAPDAIETIAPLQPVEVNELPPVENQFDMGRFGDPINLAEMPPSAQELPVNLAAQQSAMQPSPEVASALVGQEPTIPQPRQEIAASLVGQPVEVASNQFVPPSLPEIPAPKLNPEVIKVLRDPNASDRSKQVAQGLMNQHIQKQDAYKKAVAERQMQQREIDMRVSLAQQRGLDPSVAYDENMWKAAIDADFRDPASYSAGSYIRNSDGTLEKVPEARTSDIQEYEYSLTNPGFGTYQQDQRRAGATNVTVGGQEMTPGWKKIDENFGDTYLSWKSGGWADSQKQIAQLDESLGIIEDAARNGKNISGAIGALPDFVQPFINPDGTIAREGVEEVVQRSLREILGAQFTEKEGERLIARAYNPRLSPAENAKRVRRLLGQIQSMGESRQAMVEYFDENGTLRGFKGKQPSLSSLESIDREWSKEDGDISSGGWTNINGVKIRQKGSQ